MICVSHKTISELQLSLEKKLPDTQMCLQAAGPIQGDSDPLSLEVARGQWVRWGAVEEALGGNSQKPPAFLSDLGRSEGPVLCPPRVWLGVAWGPRGRLELVGQMSQHSDFQTVLPRTELQQSTSQSPVGAVGGRSQRRLIHGTPFDSSYWPLFRVPGRLCLKKGFC